jgi:hypothetical protein
MLVRGRMVYAGGEACTAMSAASGRYAPGPSVPAWRSASAAMVVLRGDGEMVMDGVMERSLCAGAGDGLRDRMDADAEMAVVGRKPSTALPPPGEYGEKGDGGPAMGDRGGAGPEVCACRRGGRGRWRAQGQPTSAPDTHPARAGPTGRGGGSAIGRRQRLQHAAGERHAHFHARHALAHGGRRRAVRRRPRGRGRRWQVRQTGGVAERELRPSAGVGGGGKMRMTGAVAAAAWM